MNTHWRSKAFSRALIVWLPQTNISSSRQVTSGMRFKQILCTSSRGCKEKQDLCSTTVAPITKLEIIFFFWERSKYIKTLERIPIQKKLPRCLKASNTNKKYSVRSCVARLNKRIIFRKYSMVYVKIFENRQIFAFTKKAKIIKQFELYCSYLKLIKSVSKLFPIFMLILIISLFYILTK